MLRVGWVLVLICAALPCAAQTLADELRAAQVPQAGFTQAELAQTINGIHAVHGTFTWVTYVRIGKDNAITGFPQVIRYDSSTGSLQRREMPAGDAENCCGSPEGIKFTQSFVIASFDDTPSAETALVLDSQLRLTSILYGFNLQEVAPDQVVFIENMIQFAAQHPERLRFVDLKTGATSELYPLKDDHLRDAFSRLNAQHMPSPQECQVGNDPCDPNLFDEDIEFLSSGAGSFQIRVGRQSDHPGEASGQTSFQAAAYTYQLKDGRWFYCEQELAPPAMVRIHGQRVPELEPAACSPSIPALADPNAGMQSPFPDIIRKVN